MQPHSPCFSLRAPVVHVVILMALGGLLAACDRHSATEVPESYGHGSSHQTSFTDHEIDSRKGTHSFSDTQGLQADEAKPAAATPAVSPAGTTQPGFFPKNN